MKTGRQLNTVYLAGDKPLLIFSMSCSEIVPPARFNAKIA
jgi:hypothetical protein